MIDLKVDELKRRHAHWLQRISDAGVWDMDDFDRVNFLIKPAARTLCGKFVRRATQPYTPLSSPAYSDTIIIYANHWLDTFLKLDSVLVHEMIHQYIAQRKIRDTSSHGQVFRSLMKEINRCFPGELQIHISEKITPAQAHAEKVHDRPKAPSILAIVIIDDNFYCCKIMPSAGNRMRSMLSSLARDGHIKSFKFYTSCHPRFTEMPSCRTRLHGIRNPLADMHHFLATYSLIPLLD